MEMQKLEKSRNSVSRLNAVIDELVSVINEQRGYFEEKLKMEKEKVENLVVKNETLQKELILASDNSKTESKILELQNCVDDYIRQNENLKNEIESLKNEIVEKTSQISELENNKELLKQQFENMQLNVNEIEDIKAKLFDEIKQKEELEQKYRSSELRISEMQNTINLTTENIDNVVARLERILEENGASGNND